MTNALYLSDRQGLPIAMSELLAGNHNDLYDIEVQFEVVTATLEQANIAVEGIFLNVMLGLIQKILESLVKKKKLMPIYALTNVMGITIEMNILTMNSINKGMLLRELMLGWTATDHY